MVSNVIDKLNEVVLGLHGMLLVQILRALSLAAPGFCNCPKRNFATLPNQEPSVHNGFSVADCFRLNLCTSV